MTIFLKLVESSNLNDTKGKLMVINNVIYISRRTEQNVVYIHITFHGKLLNSSVLFSQKMLLSVSQVNLQNAPNKSSIRSCPVVLDGKLPCF